MPFLQARAKHTSPNSKVYTGDSVTLSVNKVTPDELVSGTTTVFHASVQWGPPREDQWRVESYVYYGNFVINGVTLNFTAWGWDAFNLKNCINISATTYEQAIAGVNYIKQFNAGIMRLNIGGVITAFEFDPKLITRSYPSGDNRYYRAYITNIDVWNFTTGKHGKSGVSTLSLLPVPAASDGGWYNDAAATDYWTNLSSVGNLTSNQWSGVTKYLSFTVDKIPQGSQLKVTSKSSVQTLQAQLISGGSGWASHAPVDLLNNTLIVDFPVEYSGPVKLVIKVFAKLPSGNFYNTSSYLDIVFNNHVLYSSVRLGISGNR